MGMTQATTQDFYKGAKVSASGSSTTLSRGFTNGEVVKVTDETVSVRFEPAAVPGAGRLRIRFDQDDIQSGKLVLADA